MKTLMRSIMVSCAFTLAITSTCVRAEVVKSESPQPKAAAGQKTPANPPATSQAAGAKAAFLKAAATGPLRFEINAGQFDPQVKFASRGMNHTLYLTPSDAVLALPGKGTPIHDRKRGSHAKGEAARSEGSVVMLRLVGSNAAPEISGDGLQTGKSNYLLGRDAQAWRTGVGNYSRVRYHDIYPGIDWVHYGNQGMLEFDFVVSPGADPSRINFALDVTHAGSVSAPELNESGDLLAASGNSDVRFYRPVAYQEISGEKHLIAANYVLKPNGEVGFRLGAYDRTHTLVIDPVLNFATYLGGPGFDGAVAVAVDGTGIYVAGQTVSGTFPTTAGAAQPLPGVGTTNCASTSTPNPCFDAFVTKLSFDGATLIYSTFLGGSSTDAALSVAVDGSGQVYVAGYTLSNNFPGISANSFQSTPNTGEEAFIAKLKTDGSGILYATYLGGAGEDYVSGIAVGSTGNAFVTGFTDSTDLSGASNTAGGGTCTDGTNSFPCADFFAGEFDPTKVGAASLVYLKYIGGNGDEIADAIAVDSSGNAVVVGTIGPNSSGTNSFTATGGFQTTYGGGGADGLIVKVNSSGIMTYSSFLGGLGNEQANAIALDSTGIAYVVGWTPAADFPVKNAITGQSTSSAVDCSFASCNDAFIAKVDTSLTGASSLLFSSYLGGSNDDRATSVAVDTTGNVYLAGGTVTAQTATKPFPLANPLQSTQGGDYDMFITKLTPSGASYAIGFSTYLGGAGQDIPLGIAVNSSGQIFAVGQTLSIDFPITLGTVETFPQGLGDAFITMIDSVTNAAGAAFNTDLINLGTVGVGITSPAKTVTVYDVGSAALSISSTTVTGTNAAEFALAPAATTCGASVAGGGQCNIGLTFTPAATGVRNAMLTISDNGAGSPHNISLTGSGTNSPVVSLDTASLSFGNQSVGVASTAKTVTVTNIGGANLSITTVSSSVADFSPSGCAGSNLIPGGSCVISVTFTPSAAGIIAGSLTITTPGAGTGSKVVAMTGTGVTPDFSITASSTSQTITAGSTASYGLTLFSVGGFTSNVNFACTGAPSQATCSVTPNPATPSVAGTAVTVSVTTTARGLAPPRSGPLAAPPSLKGLPWMLALLILVLLSAMVASKRWRTSLVLAALMLLILTWAACGGGSGGGGGGGGTTGTPAGTYTLTVTGTSGSLSHGGTLTLKVN